MKWLKQLFDSITNHKSSLCSTRRVTLNNPLIIISPRICFLNLIGPSAETIINEDKTTLGPLFTSVQRNNENPPLCDVLLIYGNLESNGRFSGNYDSLRDIIRKSNAPIVIVASENDSNNYIVAGKDTGYGRANLIMTLDRRNNVFANFFLQLFDKMFKGKSMLLAWVELAPQNPQATHANCPVTIFSAEVSHIIFKRA